MLIGTLYKLPDGWIVIHNEARIKGTTFNLYPLHPDDSTDYQYEFDLINATGFNPQLVNFEIEYVNNKPFAKIIPQ